MTYLPLIPIFGPFGGNQLILALNAICSEARTTFALLSFAWQLPCCRFDVARGGNRSMAHSPAATYLNVTRESRNLLL